MENQGKQEGIQQGQTKQTETDTAQQNVVNTANPSAANTGTSKQAAVRPTTQKVSKAGGGKPVKKKKKKRLPLWLRIILKTLRLFLVPVLCVAAVAAGMVIGYVYIGKQEMDEVYNFETWRHLYDLVFKDKVE